MTIEQLRVLADIKNAANTMNLHDFAAALDNYEDDYIKEKFKDFQKLGALLATFTSGTLTKLIDYRK